MPPLKQKEINSKNAIFKVHITSKHWNTRLFAASQTQVKINLDFTVKFMLINTLQISKHVSYMHTHLKGKQRDEAVLTEGGELSRSLFLLIF